MVDPQAEREIPLYSPHLIELMRAVHEKGGVFRFQARGFSMSPFIKNEDVLTIAPPDSVYETGDVLAFIRPQSQKLAVHRAVARKKDAYFIKGDNNFEVCEFVSKENILGRVVKVERKGKAVSLGLGKEKLLIAWLSRLGLLYYALFLPRIILFFCKKMKLK